jgi:hypothetical protein
MGTDAAAFLWGPPTSRAEKTLKVIGVSARATALTDGQVNAALTKLDEQTSAIRASETWLRWHVGADEHVIGVGG